MVHFEDGRLVIIVETMFPQEDLKNFYNGLIDLLQCESEDMRGNRYYVYELLRQISPDISQIIG